ncbi:hypothetical protein FGG08_000633 [Glutinoglossum americanum]|uniref:Cytochrome P450 n=1 Tax=Glutinoglossum americanum TaxID=1670608 RepID=A0A9P8I8U0_9PEZI|nr:hypothetical protein FGG08_000633 [Glutinoglossum americanum]
MMRAFWDRAFSHSALLSYRGPIKAKVEQFIGRVGELSMPIDIAYHSAILATELMITLTFGLELTEEEIKIATLIPGFISRKFANVTNEIIRMNESSDIYGYIQQSKSDPKAPGFPLPMEARLAIVGGSVCYFLCTHPKYIAKLREEVTPLVHFNKFDMMGRYSLLEAVIKESLRLIPPISRGAERVTPPGGVMIAGRWIPGNIIISISYYSMSRGPYACVGQQLAMMEIRETVARLITSFDMRLADPNYRTWEDSGRGTFTLELPPLMIKFERICCA